MALISRWKADFPVFLQSEQPLFYLDSAASSLVPKVVADASYQYLINEHANSHRGFYPLSAKLTQRIEDIRAQVANFINAPSADNIIFNSGTTAGIHLVAKGLSRLKSANGNIVVSAAEHHANFLPWQQITENSGIELRIAPLAANGQVDLTELEALMDDNTLIVAVTHLSNVLGVENPVASIGKLTQQHGAFLLVDGAQYAAHGKVDVKSLGCDFYVFSGHKLYSGHGSGVLYASDAAIAELLPVVLGGGMVNSVSVSDSTWANSVRKFEAGTLNAQAIIALSKGLSYLRQAEAEGAHTYLAELTQFTLDKLSAFGGINIYSGQQSKPQSIISFNFEGVHSHDVAMILAEHHIAVRAGHHCAQPLHHWLGVGSTVRISLGLYNQAEDIEQLLVGLEACRQLFMPR